MSGAQLPLQLEMPVEQFLLLLDQAKAGSNEALGTLITECRRYLLSIANQEFPPELRAKLGPSDLVQESCLEAQQCFAQFRGQSREELLTWVRTILITNLSNARRHYFDTAKRQASLEIPLPGQGENPSRALGLMAEQPSPSQAAMANEEEVLVEQALSKLPDHLRQAVLLHNREHLTFAEIAQRMGRSAEAVRKLWARGVEQLQKQLDAHRSKIE